MGRSAEERLVSGKATACFMAEHTHPRMSLSQCPHQWALQRPLFMAGLDRQVEVLGREV